MGTLDDGIFQFKTKNIPQAPGTDGAHWERIPIASMPPQMDLSNPISTGNSVANAMSNLAESFQGFKNTLESVTQGLQQSACQLEGVIDNLQQAQNFATQFAKENNNTNVYVRMIGVDPVGTINSPTAFLTEVENVLLDTAGVLPKLVPAEVPLNPAVIAGVLGSNQSVLDNLLGGEVNFGALGNAFAGVSVGLGVRKLSNDQQWRNGFSSDQVSYQIIAMVKNPSIPTLGQDKANLVELTLNVSDISGITDKVTISDAANPTNNGTFEVVGDPALSTGVNDTSVVQKLLNDSLGRNLIKVRVRNPDGVNETNSSAIATFTSEPATIVSSATMVKSALEQEGYLGQTNRGDHTIPSTTLIEILVRHKLLGVDLEKAEEDKDIALERLTKLLVGKSNRIGGMILVGKAKNIGALARQVQTLSSVMEWLSPLAERLSFAALSEFNPSETGIDFNTAEVDLTKLDPNQNAGKKDQKAVEDKVKSSGVLEYKPIPLQTCSEEDNPSPTEFKAWRCFKPIQLIPGMSAFGTANDAIEGKIQSKVAQTIARASSAIGEKGYFGDKIEEGQQQLETGLNYLKSQAATIDSISEQMNNIGAAMQDGVNYLKNNIGASTVQLDGHLIGARGNLQSNQEYIDAVRTAINDISDPNLPTFGQPLGTTVASLQGSIEDQSTNIWFGVVLTIIGKDKRALADQMSVIGELLSMDTSAIQPQKTRLEIK